MSSSDGKRAKEGFENSDDTHRRKVLVKSSPSIRKETGQKEWPAETAALKIARVFLQECASARLKTLLLPDKDADGLCSAMIIYRTLVHLGLPSTMLSVHFVAKGSNIHTAEEREAISHYDARRVILLDQGSRGGQSIVEDKDVKTLIVDHHWTHDFPANSLVLSSARHPPIAPTSTLAYILCLPLMADVSVREQAECLCAVGTMGDLGTGFKWEDPFPDLRDCMRKYTKKALGEVMSLVNAPRRTAIYDVESAWNAILESDTLTEIASNKTSAYVKRLHAARSEIRAEVDRCKRSRPVFSRDGRVALIRISSTAQVHPLIAIRWTSSLKGPHLQMIMCVNDAYSNRGTSNFACRVPRCARDRGEKDVDVIEMLKQYAGQVPGLIEKLGDNFARGHQQASGGIVPTEDFESLWNVIRDDEPKGSDILKGSDVRRTQGFFRQKHTLDGWLTKG